MTPSRSNSCYSAATVKCIWVHFWAVIFEASKFIFILVVKNCMKRKSSHFVNIHIITWHFLSNPTPGEKKEKNPLIFLCFPLFSTFFLRRFFGQGLYFYYVFQCIIIDDSEIVNYVYFIQRVQHFGSWDFKNCVTEINVVTEPNITQHNGKCRMQRCKAHCHWTHMCSLYRRTTFLAMDKSGFGGTCLTGLCRV